MTRLTDTCRGDSVAAERQIEAGEGIPHEEAERRLAERVEGRLKT